MKKVSEVNLLRGEKGSSKSLLLLVLLLLVAVFGYLYFFTGLIRTPEAPKPPPQTSVKQPLPPRTPEGAPQTAAQTASAPQPQAQPAQPVPPAAAPPAVKPEAKPAAKAEEKKPAPAPQPAAPAAPKPEVKKPAPPAPPPAPAPAAKTPAAPTTAAKKAEEKPAVPAAAAPGSVKKGGEPGKGAFSLLVGEYVSPKELASVKEKLKKAGLTPTVRPAGKKMVTMNRLFLGEYEDQSEAEAHYAALKQHTQDAFVLPSQGKFLVFAGSYYVAAQAAQEQDRLFAKGFKLLMRQAQAPVKVTRLTAGSFPTKEAATQEADRLNKAGIAAKVVGGK